MPSPATSQPASKTALTAPEEPDLSLLRLYLWPSLVRQYVTRRGDPWLPPAR